MTTHTDPASFNHDAMCDVLFLPLADPERRRRDPLRALTAAKDLELVILGARESAVIEARRAGWTWDNVGDALGISAQAAHSRYAKAAAVMLKPATRWPEQPTGAP